MRYFLINDNKINVSFDFDGVIHFDVCKDDKDNGYHPNKPRDDVQQIVKHANLLIIKFWEIINIQLN